MRHLMDHSRRRAGLRLVRPLILPFALIGAVLVEPVACLAQGQESTTSAMGPQTQAHPVAVGSTISVTSVPAGPMIPGSPVPPWLLRTGSMNGLALPGPVEPRPPDRFDCGAIADATARTLCNNREAARSPAGSAR